MFQKETIHLPNYNQSLYFCKMKKITESDSLHRHLEKMTVGDLLTKINEEDHKVAPAVKKIIPVIEQFIKKLVPQMELGGRLFYIGAGTSGRLGILDASECPPTFGVPHDWVIGLIAGGDGAIRKAVEFAEDNTDGAWRDLQEYQPNQLDTVVGIAASGTTPYVVGGLQQAREKGMLTACIYCNPGSPVTEHSDFPIEVVVGPEFLTGSTRMKAGTAQKLVLNMITTTAMIRLGRVLDNKMVDMQLSNQKLVERGTRMLMEKLNIEQEAAKELLLKSGSVRKAIDAYQK